MEWTGEVTERGRKSLAGKRGRGRLTEVGVDQRRTCSSHHSPRYYIDQEVHRVVSMWIWIRVTMKTRKGKKKGKRERGRIKVPTYMRMMVAPWPLSRSHWERPETTSSTYSSICSMIMASRATRVEPHPSKRHAEPVAKKK